MPSPISSKGLPTMGRNPRSRCGDSPIQVLRWPTERARKWTCEFLNSAPANDSFLAVIAIGSAVRPNVVSADLDLIVISAEATPIHISPPMEIDLRTYSAATIDAQIASGHDLLGPSDSAKLSFNGITVGIGSLTPGKTGSLYLPPRLPAKGQRGRTNGWLRSWSPAIRMPYMIWLFLI
jgi:hypothetical protein